MASIKWLDEAIRDLDKLDNSIRIRVFKTLKKLERDPIAYGERLAHHSGQDLSNFYKIQPADGYRIVYAILNNELVVITVIGKREDEKVYKTATERIASYSELVGQELDLISKLINKLPGKG